MSIYYKTNKFGEVLCPNCGKPLFHTVICTYPPIPRYECTDCGYTAENDQIIDSGNSTESTNSITSHHTCTKFETSASERGIERRCVECGREFVTPWVDIMTPVVEELLRKLDVIK